MCRQGVAFIFLVSFEHRYVSVSAYDLRRTSHFYHQKVLGLLQALVVSPVSPIWALAPPTLTALTVLTAVMLVASLSRVALTCAAINRAPNTHARAPGQQEDDRAGRAKKLERERIGRNFLVRYVLPYRACVRCAGNPLLVEPMFLPFVRLCCILGAIRALNLLTVHDSARRDQWSVWPTRRLHLS